MVRIAEEEDAAKNCSCSADACPYSVGCTDRDRLHSLRYAKEAKNDENNRDDTRDELSEALTIFQSNRKANLKEPG